MLMSVIGYEKLLEIRPKAGLFCHGGILENGTTLMLLKISCNEVEYVRIKE